MSFSTRMDHRPSVSLVAADDGVRLCDAEGAELAHFGQPRLDSDVGTSVGAVETSYDLRGGLLRVVVEVKDAGPGPHSVVMERRVRAAAEEPRCYPVNTWTRNARGGIPFQIPAGRVAEHRVDGRVTAWEASAGSGAFDVDARRVQLTAIETSEREPGGGARAEYWFAPREITAHGAAAVISGSRVGIALRTRDPFGITEGVSAPLEATIALFNTGAADDVTLSWSIRDFTGGIVGTSARALSLSTGETEIEIATCAVGRGVYFAEATATSDNDGTSVFVRTNLVVLEPAEFPAKPTPFGLAAFRFHAGTAAGISEDEWARLSRTLGATRKRQVPGHTLAEFAKTGWQGLHQPPVDLRRTHRRDLDGPIDPDLQREGHDEHFSLLEQFGCQYIEFGNELNAMDAFDPSGGDVYARDYVIALHDYLVDNGSAAQVCTAGTQGPSLAFLDAFAEAGGWTRTGAVAHHPGRGNFVPDFAPSPREWTNGTTGTYWNFLGGLRAMRDKVTELDARFGTHHEFLLTEVYAPTFPNSWWEDTYRTSAENTLLEMALCLAEGVDEVYWYCTNDGIWQDLEIAAPHGTEHMVAREYHFGLLNLDCSLKPSALAYATATAHLSEANFRGWIDFAEQPDLHGLLFDTPRGELQLLWSRVDGYVLNAGHADEMFIADDGSQRWDEPEPWIDPWPTKTTASLAASGTVVEVNCIGQESRSESEGGTAAIVLDGAPRIFYGLASPIESDGGRLIARIGA